MFFMTDRYLKGLAVNRAGEPALDLLGNLFSFVYMPNAFIAFSLPLSGSILSALIALIIAALLIFLLRALKKGESPWLIFGWGLILAGALSNFYDRLGRGSVVDYLYLKHFTVFNLADVFITLGILAVLIPAVGHKKSRPSQP